MLDKMTDQTKIKYSIIIPVYNSQGTILELLNALENQTKKDFEVIIVDDGSKDNSLELIRAHKKNKKINYPIKLIKQENAGPAKARNVGAKHAAGDIIIFIDSDCVPTNDFIEKITLPIELHKNISGVQGEYLTKNKEYLIARYVGYEIYYRHERMKGKNIDHIATYACLYKKEDFGEGFLEKFSSADMEDTEFSYRISKSGKRLIFEPNAVVFHPHPHNLKKFIKQQFKRGYWRAFGYGGHQEKIFKDSYMGSSVVIQGSLSLLFFISLFISVLELFLKINNFFLFIPLILLAMIYITNLGFGFYCYRYEKNMIFIAPLIASIRSLAGTAGFIKGVCSKILRKYKIR